MAQRDPEKKRAYQKRYYEQNREKLLQDEKRRYQKDPEKRREQSKRRYQENRERLLEQQRAYREQHREEINARQAVYRAKNGVKIRDAKRADYAANGAALREYKRRWYQDNREEHLAGQTFGRHRLWPEDVAAIYQAQGGRCYLCGEAIAIDEVHVDHDHRCCPKLRSCPVCRRGLAHDLCNRAIGMAGDSPDRLRRIADALEAAQLAVTERMATASEQLTLGLEA